MINMHISQHARTVQCKHRDGNPKKEPKKKCQRLKKKTLTKMKNAFDGLISRQGMDQERLSDIQHISIESLKITKQKEQRLEKNIQGLWDISKMCNMCIMGIPEQEREKRTQKYLKQ